MCTVRLAREGTENLAVTGRMHRSTSQHTYHANRTVRALVGSWVFLFCPGTARFRSSWLAQPHPIRGVWPRHFRNPGGPRYLRLPGSCWHLVCVVLSSAHMFQRAPARPLRQWGVYERRQLGPQRKSTLKERQGLLCTLRGSGDGECRLVTRDRGIQRGREDK